jgi:ketosteroid isomerase-like protein
VSSHTSLDSIGVLLSLSIAMLPSQSSAPAAAEPRQPPQNQLATVRAPVEEDAHEVERQVEAFLDHYVKTLESKDAAAIRTLFVDDDRLAWFTDGVRAYSTPEEVLAGMRSYEGTRFSTRLWNIRVLPLAAGLASAESSFETKLTIPGSSGAQYGGVITWLVEKDPQSGAWRVLIGHTSTPGGPPTPSAGNGRR